MSNVVREKSIENINMFNDLLINNPNLIVTTYRGDWCPFCMFYLRRIQKIKVTLDDMSVEIMAFSAQSAKQNEIFKNKSKIDFEIYSDPNLVLRDEYDVPVCTTHRKSKTYLRGAFLQPSVLMFKDGKLDYAWRQTNKLSNLRGAVKRLDVSELVTEAEKIYKD